MNTQLPVTMALDDLAVSAYMRKVYLWMIAGLGVTAISAYYTSIFTSNLMIDVILRQSSADTVFTLVHSSMLAQLVVVIALSLLIKKISALWAKILFVAYAILVGISLSSLSYVYSIGDIVSVFCITTFSFVGLSAYGFYTQRNLNFLGTFCTMGLFGLVGFWILGFFNPALFSDKNQLISAVIGIIVFSGLTAFDTKKIKNLPVTMGLNIDSAAIFGALQLYLDYINLFLSLLRLFRR